MSSRSPNCQQIPKETRYRKGLIPERMHLYVRADYSQLEARLVAEVSGDKILLGIFERGDDVHTATAQLMTGKPADQIQKSERSAAKTVSFGAIYGCSARTLRQTAISMFGITWSMEEAQEKLDAWKDSYPGIVKWHQKQGRQQILEVRTVFGRRRKLQRPRKATKANGLERDESNYTRLLNSPIQGLGADVLKAALVLLWEQYLCEQSDIKLVAVVHDEIILEAPESKVEYAKQILQECMEDAAPMVGVLNVPIIAEPSSGPSWGEV
jgi:DNA polymerase I-like protein with 3'-5' exonuclease and polymerase domains